MKYKFEQFNVELIDPKIKEVQASYKLDSDMVQVNATLDANGNKLFNVFLGEMENTDNWGDDDIMDFALQQLEKFKV